jgi:hypothetical protein
MAFYQRYGRDQYESSKIVQRHVERNNGLKRKNAVHQQNGRYYQPE